MLWSKRSEGLEAFFILAGISKQRVTLMHGPEMRSSAGGLRIVELGNDFI
jgi:hypothetical protein